MNNHLNASNNKLTGTERGLAVGLLTGGLIMTSLGAASSHSFLGISAMTLGIFSVGALFGWDIGRRKARKAEVPA